MVYSRRLDRFGSNDMTFQAANYRVQVTFAPLDNRQRRRPIVPNPFNLLAIYTLAAVLGAILFLIFAAAIAYPDGAFAFLSILSGAASGITAAMVAKVWKRSRDSKFHP